MSVDKGKTSRSAPEQLSSRRIDGVVDLPRPNRAAGWAMDRADPNASVTVEVLRDGRVLAETRATAFRGDLESSGIGTGRYGFSVELEDPVPPGLEFTVSARVKISSGAVEYLRPFGKTALSTDPSMRLLQDILIKLNELSFPRGPMGGSSVEMSGTDDVLARTLEVCERVELVQARLDTMNVDCMNSSDLAVPRWLLAMAAIALLFSSVALAMGILSLF